MHTAGPRSDPTGSTPANRTEMAHGLLCRRKTGRGHSPSKYVGSEVHAASLPCAAGLAGWVREWRTLLYLALSYVLNQEESISHQLVTVGFKLLRKF